MNSSPIIIKDISIISKAQLTENKTIFIKNGIIQSIIDDIHQLPEEIKLAECICINGTGKYLSPGLIDNHVHLILKGSSHIIDYVNSSNQDDFKNTILKNCTNSIQNGITTIVDMGDSNGLVSTIKKNKQSDQSSLPRLFSSGQMISIKKGHVKTIAREISDETDIELAINQQVEQGNEFIKLIVSGGLLTKDSHPLESEMNLNTLKSLCNQANKHETPVAAHAYSDKDILNAINTGASRIEHGIWASTHTLKLAAKHKISFCPTLKASYDIINHKDQLPTWMVCKAEKILSKAKDFIKNVKKNQVNIVMGTDAGTPFNVHGQNAKELEYYVENGLSIEESIVSATNNAAKILGKDHFIGDIKKDYAADLLILNKNPLDDITSYQNHIKNVIFKGKLIKKK